MNSPLAIVMPVLDEAGTLPAVLDALQPLRQRGVQLVVADGDGDDAPPPPPPSSFTVDDNIKSIRPYQPQQQQQRLLHRR